MGVMERIMMALGLKGGGDPQIVCIGAHCDDIEIGCGGSLIAMAQAYPTAHFHCWVFSGDEVRSRESANCLSILLGAGRFSLHVFEFRDGYFPAEWLQIKQRLSELSRSVDADIVFTHASAESHQDHRTLSELTWNHFRSHLILEYEIIKYEGDLGRVNLYIPMTEFNMAAKLNALLGTFESQKSKSWFTRSTFEAIARLRGVECNAADGYAEAFYAKKNVLQLLR